MKNRFGRRNLLYRWVSRHARATALFRFAQHPDQSPRFESDSRLYRGMPSLAYLIPQPERLDFIPNEVEAVAQQHPAPGIIPQVKPKAIQPTPKPISQARQTSDGTKDPIWRRLQNILHRHQEAETAGEQSVVTPDIEDTNKFRLQPAESGNNEVIAQENRPLSQSEPVHSEEGAGKPAETRQRTKTLFEEGELPSQVNRSSLEKRTIDEHDLKVELPTGKTDQMQRITEVQGKPTSLAIEPERSSESIQRKIETQDQPTPLQTGKDRHPPSKIGEPERSLNIPPGSFLQTEESSRPENEGAIPLESEEPFGFEQTVPLEAIWPVQTRVQQPRLQKTTSGENVPEETPMASAEAQALQTHRDEVETILQSIAPADQTTSKVEVITPRRLPPQKVARKPIDSTGKPTQKEKPTEELPGEPTVVVQDKSGPSPSMNVPTEIGGLPADLWELIGEPIPDIRRKNNGQSTGKGNEPVNSSIARSPQNVPPPESRGMVDSFQEEVPGKTVSKPAIIQRQTAEPSPESAPPAGGQAPSTPSENQIEELARRIYSEIRRKLHIDRERYRNS